MHFIKADAIMQFQMQRYGYIPLHLLVSSNFHEDMGKRLINVSRKLFTSVKEPTTLNRYTAINLEMLLLCQHSLPPGTRNKSSRHAAVAKHLQPFLKITQ